jgi:hypothetical protein
MAAYARKVVHFKDGLVDQVDDFRSSNDGSTPLNAFN